MKRNQNWKQSLNQPVISDIQDKRAYNKQNYYRDNPEPSNSEKLSNEFFEQVKNLGVRNLDLEDARFNTPLVGTSKKGGNQRGDRNYFDQNKFPKKQFYGKIDRFNKTNINDYSKDQIRGQQMNSSKQMKKGQQQEVNRYNTLEGRNHSNYLNNHQDVNYVTFNQMNVNLYPSTTYPSSQNIPEYYQTIEANEKRIPPQRFEPRPINSYNQTPSSSFNQDESFQTTPQEIDNFRYLKRNLYENQDFLNSNDSMVNSSLAVSSVNKSQCSEAFDYPLINKSASNKEASGKVKQFLKQNITPPVTKEKSNDINCNKNARRQRREVHSQENLMLKKLKERRVEKQVRVVLQIGINDIELVVRSRDDIEEATSYLLYKFRANNELLFAFKVFLIKTFDSLDFIKEQVLSKEQAKIIQFSEEMGKHYRHYSLD